MKTAEQFIENGYYEEAIEQYGKIITNEPNNGEAYEKRAEAYKHINNFEAASEDFKYAAVLEINPAQNYYEAGVLLYKLNNHSEALELLEKASEHKSKFHDAYTLQSVIYQEAGEFKEALEAANKAIDAKGTAYAYYLAGVSLFNLENYDAAEQNLEKAIIKDRELLDAYLVMAKTQLRIDKIHYAIENCTYVLMKDRRNVEASVIRSMAHSSNGQYERAIEDISRAIAIDSVQSNYYLTRATYYYKYAQYQQAINDYTLALNNDVLNKEALIGRAEAYEALSQKDKAASDYSLLLTLMDDAGNKEITAVENKIYELQRESKRPKIQLTQPLMNDKLEVQVAENLQSIEVNAHVEDDSKIRFLKINNDTLVNIEKGVSNKLFSHYLSTRSLEYLTISAIDIYNNTTTVSYAVEHVETNPPVLAIMNPYVDDNGIIALGADERYLYLEGRIEDESLIKSVMVDETNASYTPGDYNPRFTANIDVQKKNRITVQATDIYGNRFETVYHIQRSNQITATDNPMGKTWVVLIENSEYKEFGNLTSPEKDVALMQQALDRYQIHKVIVKRNLSKREMERFFAIDLRDLVRANQVNSLFIWFAGHGKNLNGTGYWIPSDARLDVEFSYFNINALKASLYSYQSLKHILVVSDACETGPAFCEALRGPIDNVSCQETSLTGKRSAQVLTSAGSGYAFDRSLFTQSFVNTLLNNDDDCVSIDDIARRVSYSVGDNSAQKPEFGRISGIKDELGTFFFITK